MEKKKITEEELLKVKELNKKLYENLVAIGDMEFSILDLTERKELAVSEQKKTLAQMTQYKVELGKKYESTKVDMSTGVLS
jgi:hypothetical protein